MSIPEDPAADALNDDEEPGDGELLNGDQNGLIDVTI